MNLRHAGKVTATAYLGGTAAYVIVAAGLKLQAVALAGDRIFREGDSVDITISPEDCVLLGQDGKRL